MSKTRSTRHNRKGKVSYHCTNLKFLIDFFNYLGITPEDYSELTGQLSHMRKSMCGIGTNRLKRFLGRKIKEGDKVAELFRTALDLEDANIMAKKYWGSTHSDHYYESKKQLLKKLSQLCKERGNIIYGYQYVDDELADINAVMYYELPGCEQISFHCHLWRADAITTPKYPNEWDGQRNSTLPKLEKAILAHYGEEIAGLRRRS